MCFWLTYFNLLNTKYLTCFAFKKSHLPLPLINTNNSFHALKLNIHSDTYGFVRVFIGWIPESLRAEISRFTEFPWNGNLKKAHITLPLIYSYNCFHFVINSWDFPQNEHLFKYLYMPLRSELVLSGCFFLLITIVELFEHAICKHS